MDFRRQAVILRETQSAWRTHDAPYSGGCPASHAGLLTAIRSRLVSRGRSDDATRQFPPLVRQLACRELDTYRLRASFVICQADAH